jgi:hypothetical protein
MKANHTPMTVIVPISNIVSSNAMLMTPEPRREVRGAVKAQM